jgi:preprotein translocase subunit SecF
MSTRLTRLGNGLYTGEKSFNFVGKRMLWYGIGIGLVLFMVVSTILRGGFVFGIEFRGGSEFRVSQPAVLVQQIGVDAVNTFVGVGSNPRASIVGGDSIRIQTEQLTQEDTLDLRDTLATAYDVPITQVTASFIGATWGQDVTNQALRGLVVFLILVFIVMALYFRTWKMSLAAMTALVHDVVITAGVYGVLGFEITPAAVIGFLTVLGYSLYDTVVVFDKVRENTSEVGESSTKTFAELANLAINQTLVRSINTSVVAVLPVGAILFIGSFLLGAGTLRDIALALFIGVLVGTYSSVFIAGPMYVHLRENEPESQKLGIQRKRPQKQGSGAVR